MDGKFRAPQFSFRKELDERPGARSPSKAELMQLFGPGTGEQAPAPTVVVKRRRAVALAPADGVAPASASASASASDGTSTASAAVADGMESRQRVFRVERREVDPPALALPPGPSPADGGTHDGDAAAPSPIHRRPRAPRRRAPDAQRPGDVVVMRPPPPAVALSELEDELAQATRLLESLAAAPRQWDFDLGIHARWAAVEDALGRLKSSAAPGAAAIGKLPHMSVAARTSRRS